MNTAKKFSVSPKFKFYLLFLLFAICGYFSARLFFNSYQESLKLSSPPSITKALPYPVSAVKLVKTEEAKLSSPALAASASEKTAAPTKTTAEFAKEIFRPQLTLNGIFFSGGKVYALINNHIVKEGDVIEGAKVLRISMEGIELAAGNSKFKLSK